MFLRALVAFVVQPGLVAYVIPSLIVRPWAGRTPFVWIGLLPLVTGTVLLLKGTLAPWAPPTRLVAVALYRVPRNPMSSSRFTCGSSWAKSRGSPAGTVMNGSGIVPGFRGG
jgi:hypothetical protein